MQTALAEKPNASTAITADNYSYLQRYIYQESGIVIDLGKNYLLESRLLPIVKQENLATLNDLCSLLRATASPALKSRVVESMTTNETLFFRDPAVFGALQRHVLPQLVEARRAVKRISIWSAAASSGQEAYSVAILLREMGLEGWRIHILGTDLNQQILDKAAAGRYLQIEVNRGLPAKHLVRYFNRAGLDWQINNDIRPMVTFQRFDLRSSMHTFGPFDLVLCRNVLIYFDVETKKQILGSIRQTIAPGGLLALGAAETTINLDSAYTRVSYGQAAFYQVP
ncbi:MAG: protein-glutamate O-methyltransferase CheR [Acidobacteria bacterium]|nr:protein-glutamate O-methyltransferase CheR [Acidobacteriota bacterium]